MFLGRRSGFRAGFRSDSDRANMKFGSPASFRPAGEAILRLPQLDSGQSLARFRYRRETGSWARFCIAAIHGCPPNPLPKAPPESGGFGGGVLGVVGGGRQAQIEPKTESDRQHRSPPPPTPHVGTTHLLTSAGSSVQGGCRFEPLCLYLAFPFGGFR